MDRFSALPDDILYLIRNEIRDPNTLFSLSLVSRNFYEVFNCRLYERVRSDSEGQMHTVALSQSERVPLTGPHPASYVKTLQLLLRYEPVDEEEHRVQKNVQRSSFRKEAISALHNIADHHAILRRLEVYFPAGSDAGLHEVFRANSNRFSYLKELVIGYPMLKRECLDVFDSFCRSSPSLNSLTLDWSKFGNTSDADAITRLMETIPEVCPSLEAIGMLHLSRNISKHSFKTIQKAIDDPNFTFPLLKSCRCASFVSCNTFFLRHPGIKKLECTDSSDSFESSSDLLPNLEYFSGRLPDYNRLCTKNPPPIESLVVSMPLWSRVPTEEENIRFINGLVRMRTLRKLLLHHYGPSEISMVSLVAIIKACPRLTHFACILSREASAEQDQLLYSAILHNLTDLEHLKLRFRHLSDHIHISPKLYSDYQILSAHHSLRTIHIEMHGAQSSKHFYFVKDKNGIIPVDGLDPNRFNPIDV